MKFTADKGRLKDQDLITGLYNTSPLQKFYYHMTKGIFTGEHHVCFAAKSYKVY